MGAVFYTISEGFFFSDMYNNTTGPFTVPNSNAHHVVVGSLPEVVLAPGDLLKAWLDD